MRVASENGSGSFLMVLLGNKRLCRARERSHISPVHPTSPGRGGRGWIAWMGMSCRRDDEGRENAGVVGGIVVCWGFYGVCTKYEYGEKAGESGEIWSKIPLLFRNLQAILGATSLLKVETRQTSVIFPSGEAASVPSSRDSVNNSSCWTRQSALNPPKTKNEDRKI